MAGLDDPDGDPMQEDFDDFEDAWEDAGRV